MSQSSTAASIMSFISPARRRSRLAARAEIRRLRRDWRSKSRKYGQTEAEQQSKRELRQRVKRQARVIAMGRRGRRIDLLALLDQRRPDGQRRWAVVDPLQPIDSGNGGVREADGVYRVRCLRGWNGKRREARPVKLSDLYWSSWQIEVTPNGHRDDSRPTAIPPLPKQARRIVEDLGVRRRAAWVGLLYQPEEWMERQPDPAIVVEWLDRPGEYYALAVWGHDGPRIMEFVD